MKDAEHDIECVEDLLIYKMNIRQENIVKLTSSKANNSDKPSESSEKWPTYENIVVLHSIILQLLHNQATKFISITRERGKDKEPFTGYKGKDGLDNMLVPVGIGNNETRYLRDIEIIKILKEMLVKLVVTLVLDTMAIDLGEQALIHEVLMSSIAHLVQKIGW